MYTLELLCRVLNCKLSDIVTTDPDPEDEEIPSYDIY
jgi:DNA-binding Xre family transcriptional regulator